MPIIILGYLTSTSSKSNKLTVFCTLGVGLLGLLGLLELQVLLRDAERNRRLASLAEARRKIAAAGVPPLTMEEIEAEIESDRVERRQNDAG